MTNIKLSDTYLTVSEVSELTKFSKSMLYALVRQSILPHLKIGRAIRIPKIDLEEFLEEHKVNGYDELIIRGDENGNTTSK